MLAKSLFSTLIISLISLAALSAQNPPHSEEEGKVVIKRQHKEIDAMYDTVYQWRIKQTKLNDFYIPLDLYDCFRQLDKLMEPAVREKFMAFSDEEVDAKTHGSLGIWLDHKWQLTDGSRLSAYFNKMGIPHPQYMVGVIIQTYHRYLHKRDLGAKELVKKYKDMWQIKQKEEAKKMLEHSKSNNSHTGAIQNK